MATNVAEEGLDLQFAHCMVNYDLPWNPMRIEQRIGRVDRIGQKSKIIQIINLSMPNTIEDRMLTLLFERLRIFELSIGDLETVMGDVIDELQGALFKPGPLSRTGGARDRPRRGRHRAPDAERQGAWRPRRSHWLARMSSLPTR